MSGILLQALYGDDASEAKDDAHGGAKAVHAGYTCDGCGLSPIMGTRYKCTVCEDFDLCETCERNGYLEAPQPGVPPSNHKPDHPFLKLRTSRNTMAIPTPYSQCKGHDTFMFLQSEKALSDLGCICPICLCVCKDARVTECGHTYCRDCLLGALIVTERCPLCRSPVPQDSVSSPHTMEHSHAIRVKIDALEVMCPKAAPERSCEWTGTLVAQEKHTLEDCVWKACSFEKYGCGFVGTSQQVQEHMARSSAEHFGLLESQIADMKTKLEATGAKFLSMRQELYALVENLEPYVNSAGRAAHQVETILDAVARLSQRVNNVEEEVTEEAQSRSLSYVLLGVIGAIGIGFGVYMSAKGAETSSGTVPRTPPARTTQSWFG